MLSHRNCFKLLVKMITASPIARYPSFKFLTMQMQPPASWARNCGPFYPRPPCSQTSRTASDDLASSCRSRGWATRAAGYRAATLCYGTNAKCRPALKLSAFRDRPEARGQNDEFDPKQTQAVLKSLLSVNRPDRAAYTNMDRYKRPLQIVHLTQGRPIRLENIFGA